ncbi:MAG: ankyrin repeat domain-containing protein [Colwellia sp.]|nr:ankyrin repeat domain-containing protein [Colwellia sp.]
MTSVETTLNKLISIFHENMDSTDGIYTIRVNQLQKFIHLIPSCNIQKRGFIDELRNQITINDNIEQILINENDLINLLGDLANCVYTNDKNALKMVDLIFGKQSLPDNLGGILQSIQNNIMDFTPGKKTKDISFSQLFIVGNLNQIKHLLEDNEVEISYMNSAAENGHLNILKWALKLHINNSNPNLLPSFIGFHNALLNGHLNVVKWFHENLELTTDGSTYDRLLRVLTDGQGVLPKSIDLIWAGVNGHYKILKWAASKGVFVTIEGMNRIAQADQLNIVKWLSKSANGGLVITEYWDESEQEYIGGIDEIAKRGFVDILKWHYKQNFDNLELDYRYNEPDSLPDVSAMNEAAANGYIKVLNWGAKHELYPNNFDEEPTSEWDEGYYSADFVSQDEITQWGIQQGLIV